MNELEYESELNEPNENESDDSYEENEAENVSPTSPIGERHQSPKVNESARTDNKNEVC
jgi:hypothetical protein